MKKLILAGLAALLALSFIACDVPGIVQEGDNNVPFVQSYSPDKVVINLDGYGDVEAAARALSLPIAQEAYNFLEVVFQGGPTTAVIARSSWERGKAMSISGVYRGATGAPIDYATAGGATPSATVGNAVMFAGRKIGNEVTLLAVGKIIEVDGTTGSEVSPTSKSVTFGLAALTGNTIFGTSSFAVTTGTPTNGQINFSTVAATPLNVTAHSLSDTPVTGNTNISSTYTLGSSTSAFLIADMLAGIRVVALDTSAPDTWKEGFQAIEPVYLMPNGQQRYIKGWDAGKFTGTITGLTAGSALVNPIGIQITIAANAEGAGAFYFSIPVVACTPTTSSSTPTVPAQRWYVRPGIDVAHLDNSTANSSGGAILITSAVSNLDDLEIGIK